MTTLKLEVDKSYRTRDGRKVTILSTFPDDIFMFAANNGEFYMDNGEYWGDGEESRYDLISEWQDEPAKLPGSQKERNEEWENFKERVTRVENGLNFPKQEPASHPAAGLEEFQVFPKGITLRQWYAGLAMQGLCIARTNLIANEEWILATAAHAYRVADQMLKEGEK